MNFLNKLERKYGRFAIKNLIYYVIALNIVVFFLKFADQSGEFIYRLFLDPTMVLKGEVWRIVTFIFIPPSFDPIWVIFALYFYYMIGTGLEQEWGSFKFNVYYFIGMLGTIIAAFISGYGQTGVYLNLSLFLAFAYIYPNYEVLVFFILPMKMKYLAWIDAAFLALSFFRGDLSAKLAIVAALINFFLFFGRDMMHYINKTNRSQSNKRRFQANKEPVKDYFHRCTVCGITEKDDKNMEFRYCSGCEGHYEYCMKHLKDHEHIKKVIEVDFKKDK